MDQAARSIGLFLWTGTQLFFPHRCHLLPPIAAAHRSLLLAGPTARRPPSLPCHRRCHHRQLPTISARLCYPCRPPKPSPSLHLAKQSTPLPAMPPPLLPTSTTMGTAPSSISSCHPPSHTVYHWPSSFSTAAPLRFDAAAPSSSSPTAGHHSSLRFKDPPLLLHAAVASPSSKATTAAPSFPQPHHTTSPIPLCPSELQLCHHHPEPLITTIAAGLLPPSRTPPTSYGLSSFPLSPLFIHNHRTSLPSKPASSPSPSDQVTTSLELSTVAMVIFPTFVETSKSLPPQAAVPPIMLKATISSPLCRLLVPTCAITLLA